MRRSASIVFILMMALAAAAPAGAGGSEAVGSATEPPTASGDGWWLADCDDPTETPTDQFGQNVRCVSLHTDSSKLAWRPGEKTSWFWSDPDGNGVSVCPVNNPCPAGNRNYDGMFLESIDMYFYVSGEDRALGTYRVEVCVGANQFWCSNTVDTTFEILPPPPKCKGRTATIWGTSGPDTLNGTAGADVIVGLEGNDKIYSLGGNDLVCAGRGDDLVRAGPGKDRVFGESGDDRIFGAGGDDRLYGNGGSDILKAQGGDDFISGGPGPDFLHGAAGDDVLKGSGGRDRLVGGRGFDSLNGGPGPDTCVAGELLVSC